MCVWHTKLHIWFRPALCVKCPEMTFVVICRHINKDWLINFCQLKSCQDFCKWITKYEPKHIECQENECKIKLYLKKKPKKTADIQVFKPPSVVNVQASFCEACVYLVQSKWLETNLFISKCQRLLTRPPVKISKSAVNYSLWIFPSPLQPDIHVSKWQNASLCV